MKMCLLKKYAQIKSRGLPLEAEKTVKDWAEKNPGLKRTSF